MLIDRRKIISFVNIVAMLTLLAFIYFVSSETIQITLLILLGMLIIVQLIIYFKLYRNLLIIYLIILSYAVKVGYSIMTANEFYFKDSIKYKYEINIIANSDMNIEQIIHFIGSIQFGYHIISSILYKLADTDYILVIVNIILSIFSSLLFYSVIKKDFNEKVAMFTLVFSLFSTNILLFSSHILKDVLVLFFISFSIYLYKNHRIYLAIFMAILLIPIRIYAGLAIIIAIIFDILIINKISKIRKVLIFITSSIFLSIFLSLPISRYFIDNINSFISNYSLIDIFISPFSTFIKFYFSPLIWNFNTIDSIYRILLLDSFIMLIISIYLILFILKVLSNKVLLGKLVIYIVPVLVHAIALGLEYDGSADRQRIGVYYILIMFIGIGIFYKDNFKVGLRKSRSFNEYNFKNHREMGKDS